MKVLQTWGESSQMPSLEMLMPLISICGGTDLQQDNGCYYKVYHSQNRLYWESGIVNGKTLAGGIIEGVKVKYELRAQSEYAFHERFDTLEEALSSRCAKPSWRAAISMVAEISQ